MFEWYIFLVQAVDLKPQKTEEVACVARPVKNGGARGRLARGEGGACREGPRKSFQLAFCECGYFQLVERLPREKLIALGQENCQSILHEQRSEGLIYYTTSSWNH